MKAGIQAGILTEAVEMVGKATTMSASEMDSEKKQKLSEAMHQIVHGRLQEKGEATLDGIRQGFGLSIANGVERANEALETVRQDATENKAYAVAKGAVNVPTQMMRGIVVDTAKEVTQGAIKEVQEVLPDLPQFEKFSGGGKQPEMAPMRSL